MHVWLICQSKHLWNPGTILITDMAFIRTVKFRIRDISDPNYQIALTFPKLVDWSAVNTPVKSKRYTVILFIMRHRLLCR